MDILNQLSQYIDQDICDRLGVWTVDSLDKHQLKEERDRYIKALAQTMCNERTKMYGR